jgi:hypothetical protein
VAHLRGDHARAVSLLERSAALARGRGTRLTAAEASAYLAAALLALGDIDRAAPTLREAILVRQYLPGTIQVSDLLALAAALTARRGHAAGAARLLGAAHVQRERLGLVVAPTFAQAMAVAEGAARVTLGDEAFSGAYAEGRALSLDDAVALALEQTASA